MAYFLLIASHPKWPLYMVASYIDQDGDYVCFDLRRTRKRKYFGSKDMFMLSWGIKQNRLMPSSEWRDLIAYDVKLAEWAKDKIERYMANGEVDVEVENCDSRQPAGVAAG